MFIYKQIDLVIGEIKQAIQKALLSLEHLKLQLNVLSNEKLTTTIISPDHLREMILNISRNLPDSLKLPDNPNKNVWKFYQYLTTKTIITSKHIMVIVSIPLLDYSSTFEVFQVHNIKIPLNQTNDTKQSTNLAA